MANRFDNEEYLAQVVKNCRKQLKKKDLWNIMMDTGHGLYLNREEMETLEYAIKYRKELW